MDYVDAGGGWGWIPAIFGSTGRTMQGRLELIELVHQPADDTTAAAPSLGPEPALELPKLEQVAPYGSRDSKAH